MRVCPQYEQLEEHSDSDSDDENNIDDGAVFSDEASHNLDTSTADDTETSDATASEFTDAEDTEEDEIESDIGEEIDARRGNDDERDSLDDSNECTTS